MRPLTLHMAIGSGDGCVPPSAPTTDLLLRSLLALGPEVCGDAPRSDYLYLLVCLAFLRLHDQDRWAQLTRAVPPSGDPGDARRLLRRVVAAVDGSLGYPDLLRRPGRPAGPAAAACFRAGAQSHGACRGPPSQ